MEKPTREELYNALSRMSYDLTQAIRVKGGQCKYCLAKERGECVDDGIQTCSSAIINAYIYGGKSEAESRKKHL
jgi:hypothetical protein